MLLDYLPFAPVDNDDDNDADDNDDDGNVDDDIDQVGDVTAEVDGVPNHEGCRKSQNHL